MTIGALPAELTGHEQGQVNLRRSALGAHERAPLPGDQRGKRMLKFAQLRSKAEIFAEVTRSYPAAGVRGGWQIDQFDFKPPSDRWMDAFKPLATFELGLKSASEFDKFDVWISGKTPKGATKMAKVGTIAWTGGNEAMLSKRVWHPIGAA